MPEEPAFRASLGWLCWPDRVLGDFDGDLDLDGRDELLVESCCGGACGETRAYALLDGRLRALVYGGPPVAWLRPGPLVLPTAGNSATHVRFGCRAHPNGSRVLVVRAARLREDGRWRIERARLRLEGGLVRLVGIRVRTVDPPGERPHDLRAEPCISTT